MLAVRRLLGDVVLYVRTTQRRNEDGSVVRYVALAHNRRDGAATKAEVLLNLGREDRLDADGLRHLAGSISRYLGDAQPAVDDQLWLPDIDGLGRDILDVGMAPCQPGRDAGCMSRP